jgi:hypothetical protein
MEPIRALLSTRSSRTYVALNRAARNDIRPVKEEANAAPRFRAFARTDLTGLFYSLPLGWTLSEKTGDIVSVSSGRFWDCLPQADFNQSRSKQSNADCLQVKVFHLLNGSVASAFQALKDASIAEAYVSSLDEEEKPKTKIEPDRLLACYEQDWIQARARARYQTRLNIYEERMSKRAKDGQSSPEPPPPYRESYLAHFQAVQI